jgi:hypothetical protein
MLVGEGRMIVPTSRGRLASQIHGSDKVDGALSRPVE